MSDQLELQFHEAMLDIYRCAKSEAGYTASYFLQMVTQNGGLESARRLINSDTPSEGYTRLWELGRLNISVEALVNDDPRWHGLFTRRELKRAHARLDAYGYFDPRG